jgi:hypothetical protein
MDFGEAYYHWIGAKQRDGGRKPREMEGGGGGLEEADQDAKR